MSGGQGFTSALGDIVGSVSIALIGISVACSPGTVTPNVDGTVPLTGQSTTVEAGTASPGWGQDLTGSEVTGGSGTLTLTLRPTDISGQEITAQTGSASAASDDVTVHISGVEASFSIGSLGTSSYPTGVEITSAQGSVGKSLELPITGVSFTAGLGTVSPAQEADDTLITSSPGSISSLSVAVALSGSESVFSAGTVTVTGDADLALTGAEITSAAGTIGYGEEFGLTGSSVAFEQQNMGAPGGAALTGAEVSVVTGEVHTDNDRTYALTGAGMIAQAGDTFASPLAFVSGQELTVSIQDIGPRVVELTGVSASFDTGRLDVPRKRDDAGRPKKPKKHQVEINGEIYEANSEAEALYILEKYKEEAVSVAKLALDRANKAQKKPIRKILQDARKALKPPVIEAESTEAEVILKEIEDLYRDTLMKVEISALLRKQEEEEEEAILLMLV